MNIFKRKQTKTIKLGDILIGGGNTVSVQSMLKTGKLNIAVEQCIELENAGCDIVRLAVPDLETAEWIPELKKHTSMPLIADIHFDYKLAIASLENGIDGLRINPGNIGSEENVRKIVDRLKDKKIPVRIGVNSGSINKKYLDKYGVCPESLVESALEHVRILEKLNYEEIKISVKASSVPMMINSYRILSEKVDYPLHLGVTEAGTDFAGTIKSSVGIGTLLAEGIGDTIRVSLTESPVNEIHVAHELLKSLELVEGMEFVSCPTCGRTKIDIISLAKKVEKALERFKEYPLKIAVMGCIVNGPGEAREADFGIAGGIGEGLIFSKGEILKKVKEQDLLPELVKIIENHLSSNNE